MWSLPFKYSEILILTSKPSNSTVIFLIYLILLMYSSPTFHSFCYQNVYTDMCKLIRQENHGISNQEGLDTRILRRLDKPVALSISKEVYGCYAIHHILRSPTSTNWIHTTKKSLCCISRCTTMQYQQRKTDWKSELLWFSYGYGKCLFVVP
jgi:hypothetical protein